jgi:hypothetical protein
MPKLLKHKIKGVEKNVSSPSFLTVADQVNKKESQDKDQC